MEGNPGDDIWADDLYEGFFNWPFFYDVGGSDYIAAMAVQEWNAITRQTTYDYNGGRGPLFRARYDDVHYNLVHHHVNLSSVYEPPENWFEDETERQKVHQLFDEIVMPGDVPVPGTATPYLCGEVGGGTEAALQWNSVVAQVRHLFPQG